MLLASQLHPALAAPVLGSISFLNEVAARYPRAISFAAGAPNPDHLCDMDIERYINRYLEHVCHKRGFSPAQARNILYHYGPTGGLINDVIAAALKRDDGMALAPDSLVITVGAQEALFIVLRALFHSSKQQLAVVSPCYTGVIGVAKLLGIAVKGINEGAQGIDFEELDEECLKAFRMNRPIRALYVAPDFSNPAGNLLDLNARRQLLELAERHDFFLIEDNAYAFTAAAGEEIPKLKALDKFKRVIFIATFAKSCLPGVRVGYVIADQPVQDSGNKSRHLAHELVKIKSMTTLNTSPICQAIIAGMILSKDGSIAAIEREKSVLYQRNLGLFLDALDRMAELSGQRSQVSWNRPRGGFFLRMRLPVAADMALLDYCASNYGVLWTPMSLFHLNNDGNNEVRLSFSFLRPHEIEEGVSRLANFLLDITHRNNSKLPNERILPC
jgi:(S)-3,5-dihydroxyphenylglycine transaminase